MAYLPNTDELFCFWIEEPSLQDQFAVYGQKFDAAGTRQWAANGIAFTTMTSNTIFGPYAQPTDTSAYVMYLQGNASGLNQGINAFMVNSDGNFSWSPNIVNMSDPTNQKLHSVTTISTDHVAKIAWEDTRNDGGGIYAQNINPNGTLGYVPVPVELNSFTGTIDGNKVTLNWETATEINNLGFDIERTTSVKNNNWEKIGFVEGNGTSTEPHTYFFSDKNLSSGTYNYRLKQIDNNGTYKYINLDESFTVQPVEFNLSQNYPNPFNPATMIKYSLPEASRVSLKVYNVIGKEVETLVNDEKPAGTYEVNFDAAQLPSGIYFYQLKTGNFVETKKMVYQK